MRCLLALAFTIAAAAQTAGWRPLFNGRDLEGWSGDPDLWKVENGILVGSTDKKSIDHNTFLIAKERFSDFELVAEVKLRNHNSGIQFRSTAKPGPGWIVTGYQADFSEAGDNSAWGNFYEEQGRGRKVMKAPNEGWLIGKTLVRHQDWNRVEILAQGNRIRLKLNGVQTVDLTDDQARDGVIALQLHRGESMRVEFREIKIRPIGASK